MIPDKLNTICSDGDIHRLTMFNINKKIAQEAIDFMLEKLLELSKQPLDDIRDIRVNAIIRVRNIKICIEYLEKKYNITTTVPKKWCFDRY